MTEKIIIKIIWIASQRSDGGEFVKRLRYSKCRDSLMEIDLSYLSCCNKVFLNAFLIIIVVVFIVDIFFVGKHTTMLSFKSERLKHRDFQEKNLHAFQDDEKGKSTIIWKTTDGWYLKLWRVVIACWNVIWHLPIIFFCVQIIEWDKYFSLAPHPFLFLISLRVALRKKTATNFPLAAAHFLIYITSKPRGRRDGCIIIIKIMKRLRNHLENLMRYLNFVCCLEGERVLNKLAV